MNLHSVRHTIGSLLVWLEVTGRTGRSVGNHLWEVEEGEPPELVPMDMWRTRAWWTPARYQWRPFMAEQTFANGYTPPLCGRRSAMRTRPRIVGGWSTRCPDCMRIAVDRGMMTFNTSEVTALSDTYRELRTESQLWAAAGRPDQWPEPTT
jgi:hypothetical protein